MALSRVAAAARAAAAPAASSAQDEGVPVSCVRPRTAAGPIRGRRQAGGGSGLRARPGPWRRLSAAAAVAALAVSPALAQDDGLFLPPLWDEQTLPDGESGGESGHGQGAQEPLAPGVGGTEDVVGVAAGEEAPEADPAQGRTELPAPAEPPQGAGLSAGVPAEGLQADPGGASSLLGYLEERDDVAAAAPAAPGLTGAAAALFGCPRSVLEELLRAATARADVVSSLEIEREVLTFCGERQRLVVEVLRAEAELAQIWRESTAPAEQPRPEPENVLEQLTEFEGAQVVEFVEEPVEPEPEPEPEPPRYGWFSIYGTADDLRVGVSDGDEAWYVREGDSLPGGVVVDWISVSPPGVHVMTDGADGSLPYRPVQGGGG